MNSSANSVPKEPVRAHFGGKLGIFHMRMTTCSIWIHGDAILILRLPMNSDGKYVLRLCYQYHFWGHISDYKMIACVSGVKQTFHTQVFMRGHYSDQQSWMEAGPPQICYERNKFSNSTVIIYLHLDYMFPVDLTTASVSLKAICE